MDALIVLRKPLRKTQLEPKFITTNKSKKALPKVEPIPPNSDLEESNEPPISFVQLYRDLCEEDSRSPTRVRMCLPPPRVHVNSARVDLASAARVDLSTSRQSHCPPSQRHVNTPASPTAATRSEASRSDTSLVTRYCPTKINCNRMFTEVPPSARAELTLELDYDTISYKDSRFCKTFWREYNSY